MNNFLVFLPIIIAWVLFGALHTVLASSSIKAKTNLAPLSYRRLYNVIAVLSVLFIFFLGSTIEPEYFIPNNQTTKSIGLIITTFGFLLAKLAFKPISFSAFIGIKKDDSKKLVTSGIYARIRHPLYTASLLMLVGFVLFSPSYTNLVHAICIVVYLGIGIYYEEKRLIATFGKTYEAYRKKVPMLFPGIRF